jgi:type II secretory pathway pseudopilin PulG
MSKKHFRRIPKLSVRCRIERLTYAAMGRCAFSLVEVLLTLASLGIVFGLLAPTIQKKQGAENDPSPVIVSMSMGNDGKSAE